MENKMNTQQERLILSFSGCKNDKEDTKGSMGGGYGKKISNGGTKVITYKF